MNERDDRNILAYNDSDDDIDNAFANLSDNIHSNSIINFKLKKNFNEDNYTNTKTILDNKRKS